MPDIGRKRGTRADFELDVLLCSCTCTCRWVWSAHLVGFVRKEDLVEYLCGLVLYGVHLDKVRWVATGTHTGRGEGRGGRDIPMS